MAKGQHLSRHQQGIVRRHYEHLDTRTLTQLQELTSELAVAADDKARERHWKRVATLLERADANDARIRRILDTRDVALLAALVGDLMRG
ncbi:MAG: hypothetical protein WD749_12955 [Phycisphaerales bacterium]